MKHPTLKQTEALVREKFERITDRRDQPMFGHMQRVVSHVLDQDEATRHAAWMHDLVEDTKMTFEDLYDLGYSPEVIDTLVLLTHDKKAVKYPEYIDAICRSGNRRAIIIKLADQRDNLDPKRQLGINKYVRNALRKKYAGVQEKLMEAAIHAS